MLSNWHQWPFYFLDSWTTVCRVGIVCLICQSVMCMVQYTYTHRTSKSWLIWNAVVFTANSISRKTARIHVLLIIYLVYYTLCVIYIIRHKTFWIQSIILHTHTYIFTIIYTFYIVIYSWILYTHYIPLIYTVNLHLAGIYKLYRYLLILLFPYKNGLLLFFFFFF